MSATQAIFFGFALGLTAGSTVAIAVAQDATIQNETGLSAEVGTDAGISLGVETDAEVDVTVSGGAGADDEQAEAATAAATTDVDAGADMGVVVALGEDLVGARVRDANDDWVGKISAVLDAGAGAEDRVVIHLSGFLGLGGKSVVVAAGEISVETDSDGEIEYVAVAKTEAELQALPEAQM